MSSTHDQAAAQLEAVLREAGQSRPGVFLRELAELFATYDTGRGWPPGKMPAYCRALADVPLDALQAACRALIRERTFLPVPAEIRAEVARHALAAAGVEDRAEEAWDELIAQVARRGADNRAAAKLDPVADAVITPAWWRRLAGCQERDHPSERRAFIDAYRHELQRRTRTVQHEPAKALAAGRPVLQIAGGGR